MVGSVDSQPNGLKSIAINPIRREFFIQAFMLVDILQVRCSIVYVSGHRATLVIGNARVLTLQKRSSGPCCQTSSLISGASWFVESPEAVAVARRIERGGDRVDHIVRADETAKRPLLFHLSWIPVFVVSTLLNLKNIHVLGTENDQFAILPHCRQDRGNGYRCVA